MAKISLRQCDIKDCSEVDGVAAFVVTFADGMLRAELCPKHQQPLNDLRADVSRGLFVKMTKKQLQQARVSGFQKTDVPESLD